jgi:hypothetical protein
VPGLDAQVDEPEQYGILVGRDEAALGEHLQQLLQERQHHRPDQ